MTSVQRPSSPGICCKARFSGACVGTPEIRARRQLLTVPLLTDQYTESHKRGGRQRQANTSPTHDVCDVRLCCWSCWDLSGARVSLRGSGTVMPGATTRQITEYLAAADTWQGVLESWQIVALWEVKGRKAAELLFHAGHLPASFGFASVLSRSARNRSCVVRALLWNLVRSARGDTRNG